MAPHRRTFGLFQTDRASLVGGSKYLQLQILIDLCHVHLEGACEAFDVFLNGSKVLKVLIEFCQRCEICLKFDVFDRKVGVWESGLSSNSEEVL